MKYAIIATCKEVKGTYGVVTREDTKVVVCKEEWVSHTCRTVSTGEPIPSDALLFDSRKAAEDFATYLDSDEAKSALAWWKTWHPWYIQPKSWEVVEVPTVGEGTMTMDEGIEMVKMLVLAHTNMRINEDDARKLIAIGQRVLANKKGA